MTPTSDILEGLNPGQKEAVETIDGPLLIIAGPGSGKTRVITHRIAYLVRVCGISPYRILAMTFTNKAAREMRDRLQRLVGTRADSLTVGTFHSFCAQLLRREGGQIGLSSSFTIYDADDQLSLIKQGLQMADLDPKQTPPQAVRSVISRAKSLLMDSRGLAQHSQNYFEEISARVYHHYEELLSRNSAVDFDDLLMKSAQLLQDHPEVRDRYQQRYEYLMVDEFQDTNVAQYRLSSLLTGDDQNICVVGDPDQSIYSWRSADIRNILNFQSDYPRTKTINLEQNYRSTSNILEAAQSLISVNGMRLEKGLFTENAKGEAVVVHEAYDEQEEAGFAIGEIERLVRQERIKPGDCAVMYRVNVQSRALEEACLHRGMPYRLVGGVRHPHRGELAGAVQPGQHRRVAAVGLDPVARPPRDQRRRDHHAVMAERGDLAMDAPRLRTGRLRHTARPGNRTPARHGSRPASRPARRPPRRCCRSRRDSAPHARPSFRPASPRCDLCRCPDRQKWSSPSGLVSYV